MPVENEEVELSVVAPAHNERENIRPLVQEIIAALDATDASYEIIIVDDGSTDGTTSILAELSGSYRQLRALRMTHTPPGRGNGQSAAFHAGFRAARGALVAVLDADLQNDPADIPPMLEKMREAGADMVHGDRSHTRRDSLVRKFSSLVGRVFRRLLLRDTIRDTGCSLRILTRQLALDLPLEYRGMHRFIPITARQLGYTVIEMPVNHRPRVAGKAKYGILNRAFCGIPDCMAVRWMRDRRRPVQADEMPRPAATAESKPQPKPQEAAK
jgi:glycosyltransferase involved in cell wall biosynthesis